MRKAALHSPTRSWESGASIDNNGVHKAGFLHDLSNTIEEIDDPKARLSLAFEQSEAFDNRARETGVRFWSKEGIRRLAEGAVEEMDESQFDSDAYRKLALIMRGRNSRLADEYVEKIDDPIVKAETVMQFAYDDGLVAGVRGAIRAMNWARELIEQVPNAKSRADLSSKLDLLPDRIEADRVEDDGP